MKFVSLGYDFHHDRNFKIARLNGLYEYLLLIIRSPAIYNDGDVSVCVHDSFVIFDRCYPQFIEPGSDEYINDWVTFVTESEEEDSIFRRSTEFNKFLKTSELGEICEIIKLMQNELYFGGTGDKEILELYFKVILKKTAKVMYSTAKNKRFYDELLAVKRQICNMPSKRISIELLADELHLSKSYFQHLYKDYFGVSPVADEINSRIDYSKQLLASTDFKICEISERLGYANEMQFMKQFKQKTGVTPSEYRNKNE